MFSDIHIADGDERMVCRIEDGKPTPAAHSRHLRQVGAHQLQQPPILSPAVQPLSDKHRKLRLAGEVQLGVNPVLGEQAFDLLSFLLGDHSQGAIGLGADIVTQGLIGEDADLSD